MDRSIRSVTDPIPSAPIRERRRAIRQKLHTPVYASFNGPQTGMVVDLSELLNLHEEGFAVQTSHRLEVNRAVTVCLDLPETKNYIHCSGQVVWSDETGRSGVRFSALSEKSRQVLKEWLFLNLMIGCAHHSARVAQLARRQESRFGASEVQAPRLVPISDGSATLSAVEAVRLVVREIGDDFDAILQLITERAFGFTGASGAALALLAEGKMICRARAGEQAPPLKAPVDATHGLSGECVRNGWLVSCENSETDPRVDAEVCRALGIGSLMAAPIVFDLQTVGLLEIFSPYPHRFTKVHGTVLERLVELIPRPSGRETAGARFGGATPDKRLGEAESRAAQPAHAEGSASEVVPHEPVSDANGEVHRDEQGPQVVSHEKVGEAVLEEGPEPVRPAAPQMRHRAWLALAIAMFFLAMGYLIAPVVEKRWGVTPQAAQPVGAATPGVSPRSADLQTIYLADLRIRAEKGDAEAQWQLGARYHNGEGVLRDDVQAVQWFERAAEQGQVAAQATLGAYYWAGRGVPQDLSKAYFWSSVALAQGDDNSKSRLEGLAMQMTKQQVVTAQQQAEAWLNDHNSRRAKSEAN